MAGIDSFWKNCDFKIIFNNSHKTERRVRRMELAKQSEMQFELSHQI